MQQNRTLPLRVLPADGESLHSWLLRLARRNGIPLLRLAPVLGLREHLRVPHNYALSWRVPAEFLRRIETQTGLPAGRLDKAVLDQFDALGWKLIPGSRYCIGCLSESGGIWQVRWQLPYSFACLEHRRLLAAVCPGCGRAPHSAGLSKRAGLAPSTVCVLGTRKESRPCLADLLTQPAQQLRHDDFRLTAQQWINQHLDSLDRDASAQTGLRDLGALAVWFAQRLQPTDLDYLGPQTVAALGEYRDANHYIRRQQPTATLISAALATQAFRLLTARARDRYRRFAPLLRGVYFGRNPDTAYAKGPMILSHKRLTALSEPLQQKLLKSADEYLPVSERLRYYTCTPSPRPPDPDSTAGSDRARHIPQYLWHDWIVRFLPRTGAHVDAIATDLPIALIIPGNPVRNIHATDELNPWRSNVSIALGELTQRYPDMLAAICALAGYLDTEGSPIDYRRRRATFADVDLPHPVWQRYCDQANAYPGAGTKLLNARRYLFQMLTGADLSNPQHLLTFRNGLDKDNYVAKFQRHMQTALRASLHEYAASLLHGAGIDEPLTWSPPAQCTAGLTLPGLEPTDVDIDQLDRLITIDMLSYTATARQLGITIEHVRYLTRQLYRENFGHAKNSSVAARRIRERAASMLDRAFFEREHLQSRKTLPVIAAETGFSRKIVARYAQMTGIRANPPIRKTAEIDPAWLKKQAGKLFRTNDDIAAELGLRGETVRRYRAKYGIRGRETGPGGHVVTNLAHPSLPKVIRQAVEGQRGGWQRLQRFQQMLNYPSMNSAAQAMGLHTQNLILQLDRLETDVGAQLVHRAPHRYTPMLPTGDGRRLLNHLSKPEVRELLDRYAGAFTRPKCGPYKQNRKHL